MVDEEQEGSVLEKALCWNGVDDDEIEVCVYSNTGANGRRNICCAFWTYLSGTMREKKHVCI